MSDEPNIRILYVEDLEPVLKRWLRFIRETWGNESHGVRSKEAAIKHLDDGFRPDLVIHDCRILLYDQDDVATEEAGNELYYEFVSRGLDVVILSGDDDPTRKEPYLADPPLGIVFKPAGEDKIREAVGIWLNHKKSRHE